MWIRWRGRRARFAFQAWCIVAYLHVCPAFWIKRQLQETRTWHRPGADRVDFTGQKLLCCVFYVSWHVWECCARRHTHTHTHTEGLVCCRVMCSGARRRMEARGDRGGPDGHLQTSTCVWTQSPSCQRAGRNQPAWGEEGPTVCCVAAWWNQMTLHNKHHQ